MAFCPNCGAQVPGNFCPNCGTPVAAASPGTSAGPTPGSGYVPPPTPPMGQTAGLTENTASALCYLFGLVTGIIFLVLTPYNQNRTIRFHAFQSIFLHVAVIIVWVILLIVTHGFGFLLAPLFGLAVFLLWLYMLYTAYNNKKVKLPVIGDLAEKQA
ncbi:MAG: hypothetical protein JO097_08100 [Acidobacteriaceae bacterium]|nr:hypothetical protein [Acidobacteriaceae bacterium]